MDEKDTKAKDWERIMRGKPRAKSNGSLWRWQVGKAGRREWVGLFGTEGSEWVWPTLHGWLLVGTPESR